MAGGQTHLAAGIRARIPGSKISQVTVWGWINDMKAPCPPAEVVLPICDLLGYRIRPHDLRPDLYPHAEDGMPREQETA